MTNEKMIEILNAIDNMTESQLRDVIEYSMNALILLNIREATAKNSETAYPRFLFFLLFLGVKHLIITVDTFSYLCYYILGPGKERK